jgi:hypothetical protein
MDTSIAKKLETYLIDSGKELMRHHMLLNEYEITNTNLNIHEEGNQWKNRWWRLNFIKFNFLFLMPSNFEDVNPGPPIVVCYK